MNTMSVIEYTLAFAFGISLIGLIPWYRSKGSDKWSVLCLSLSVLWLLIDATAYHLADHQEAPFVLRYAVNLLAYASGNLIFIFFVKYREARLKEKTQEHTLPYRLPMAVLALNVLFIVLSFAAGKIVVFENGTEVADHGLPLFVTVIWLLVLLYLPWVAWTRRGVTGNRFLLFSALDILPFAASLISVFGHRDFTVVLGALEIFLAVVFLQKTRADEGRIDRDERRILADKQILLEYFVDQYWSACFIDLKNDTLDVIRADNANTDAYIMDGTEADMARFIESHFHPDDRGADAEDHRQEFCPEGAEGQIIHQLYRPGTHRRRGENHADTDRALCG